MQNKPKPTRETFPNWWRRVILGKSWRRRLSDLIGWMCLMLILSLYIFPWLKRKVLGLNSNDKKGNV